MLVENLIRLIIVMLAYLIIIFTPAFIILKPYVTNKTVVNRAFMYFTVGNFYVMNVIYLLLLLRCRSRAITIIVLIAGAVFIRYRYNKTTIKKYLYNCLETLTLLSKGAYGGRLLLRRLINERLLSLKLLMGVYYIEFIGFISCMAIHAYYTGLRFVHYSGLGMEEEAVHLGFIQASLKGNIFADGVYPFGMHNIIYAISKVFGIKAFIVTRYFGFVITMWLVIMLYIMMKKLCKSSYAPLIGLILYVASNIYRTALRERMQVASPQEYGLLFLYPMGICLYLYIRYKYKEYLLLYCMCLALTVYCHYYITIMGLLLSLCINISQFRLLLKNRIIDKLLVYGLIGILIGALPMLIGIISGKPLEASISRDIDAVIEMLYEDDINVSENMVTDASSSKSLNRSVSIISDAITSYLMSMTWLIIILACMAILFIVLILRFILKRLSSENYIQLGLLLYVAMLMHLLASKLLYTGDFMQSYCFCFALSYSIPILLCMPLEIIYNFWGRNSRYKELVDKFTIYVLLVIVCVIYISGNKRQANQFYLLQTESSIRTMYNIFDEYDDYTWTLISTSVENNEVLDAGYYYDMVEMLRNIEKIDDDIRFSIPTENAFFFIEKRPIIYGTPLTVNDEVPSFMPFTEKDAKKLIPYDILDQSSDYYVKYRSTIMAKAYYWAQRYMYYFPDEMTVYYEDEDFICYHLKQEVSSPNNLAINYGYNRISN